MKATLVKFYLLAILLLGLPLLGPALSGKPLALYFEFPPRSLYVQHAPFSWFAFLVYALFILGALMPFLVRAFLGPKPRKSHTRHPLAFPWWGYPGIFFGLVTWGLAWTRFSWFAQFQPHTFTPLWIAYILTVNAMAYQRTGHCLLIDNPGPFLLLFPASALFWWFFEYLNRFVQNWQYTGADFGPWGYFCFATISFSTVLPAVAGTRQLLMSFSWFKGKYCQFLPLLPPHPRTLAFAILTLSGAGLACIGLWPNFLFPLLWMSPLLVLVSLQAVLGERHIFSSVTHGDWHVVLTPALAALICGFFWEMWNYYSLAKWIYHVPYVGRFKIFEMPLPGYAGYLPFGLQCAVIADMILPSRSIAPLPMGDTF